MKWPIFPTQITNDPSDYPDNNLLSLNGIGLIPNNHLRGLVQSIICKTDCIVTLYESNEEHTEIAHTNGFYILDDQESICTNYFFLEKREFPQRKSFIISIFNNSNIDYAQFDITEHFMAENYVYYKKQHNSQITSIFVPIKVDINIVCVIEVTNISLHNYTEVDLDKRLVSNFDSESFLVILSDIRVKLEAMLTQKLLDVRKNFIYEHNELLINDLRKNIAGITVDTEFSDFWSQVGKTLKKVISIYPADFLRIFASPFIVQERPTTLQLVATSESNKIQRNYSMNLSLLSEIEVGTSIITSREDKRLLKLIIHGNSQISLDPKTDLVRIFPSALAPQGILAIWIKYNDSWRRLKDELLNSELEKSFKDSINSFYTYLSSNFTSLISYKSLIRFHKTYKIFGHEVNNLCTALSGARMRYIGSPYQLNLLTPKRLEELNALFETLTNQVSLISSLSREIVSDKPAASLRRRMTPPADTLLIKWRDLYKFQCSEHHLKIIVTENKSIVPAMYVDAPKLENLIYNIIENCRKYSYTGCNIHIAYAYNEASRDHILTFKNYSNKIDTSRNIYKLFERGEVDTGSRPDGLGVGLYLALTVAQVHGGSIKHKCNLISKFNIPLLHPYISLPSDKKSPLINNSQIEDELRRVIELGHYRDIVALDENDSQKFQSKYVKRFELYIFKPTYEIIFEVNFK